VISLRGGKESAADAQVLRVEIARLGDEVEKTNRKADASRLEQYTNKLGKLNQMISDGNGRARPSILLAGTLGASIVPLAATALGAIGAMTAAFGPAAVGAIGFGAIFGSQLKTITQSGAAIEKLQQKINATYGPAFATQHTAALQQMTLLQRQLNDQIGPGGTALAGRVARTGEAWDTFKQSFNPQIMTLIGIGLTMIGHLLPIIHPLILAVANAFISVAQGLDHMITGPGFKGFIEWMTGQAGAGIKSMAAIIENLAIGFWDLIRAFTPASNGMRTGLVGMSQAFADWASHLGTNGGFQSFLRYLHTEGPVVLHVLGQLAMVLIGLAPTLGAAGQTALILLGALAGIIQWVERIPGLGPLIGSILGPTLIVVKLAGPLIALGKAFLAARASMVAFFVAMRVEGTLAMAVPIIALLVAVAAAGVYMGMHWKQTKQVLASVWGWIKTAAVDTANWVTTAWDNVVKFLERLPGRVWKAIKGIPVLGDAINLGNHAISIAGSVAHSLGIPGLAAGGTTTSAGLVRVGEHGPEVMSLPQGATVTPLKPGSMTGQPTPIILQVDGREFARVYARQALMAQAAGA
jgi:hypothetical protein